MSAASASKSGRETRASGSAGSLRGVLRPGVQVEQHVGAPRRLVAAAHVEHQVVVSDRHGDPPVKESRHWDITDTSGEYGT